MSLRTVLPTVSLFLFLLLTAFSADPVDATIWNVYENGSGDAPTIQAAFDSTANGDTIAIHCGDYAGSTITVFAGSQNVRFIGQGVDPSCVRIRFDIEMYADKTFFENLTFAYGSSVIIDFDEEPGTGGVGDFQDCVFDSSNVGMSSSASFTDCVFQRGIRNEGGSVGGYYDGGAIFDRCVFRDSHAGGRGGAVYYDGNGSITGRFAILNSIVSGTVQGETIHVADLAPKLFCTDIWGNAGGDWTGPLADSLSVNGNFSLNPKFCDAAAGNFDLKPGSPCLVVFDLRGREVRRQETRAAARSVVWDGRDESGSAASPGIYFLRVSTDAWPETAKITLLR